jgi:glycerol-3-phosphate cytidylyltransferase
MTIGYTTGVFDLFHIGHLNILRRSKENCDFLIVGVSTDSLCFENKHKFPVIPFDERVEIIKSIKYVDLVVYQNTMNKMEAWKQYQFHKMFVGNDWKGTEKWNKLELNFNKIGVTVEYFEYTLHTSSTLLRSILEKI